ncbi:hypothetical protein PV11_02763 [Exophiala sideris]|uniref:Uncharacterized protein n=1 Tax=Exophiala sideris TaxID=1016849 RepID=A0A0D1XGC6_9EURO|nr:hypothetical protein PV11_02763 [Exophiala sideris]
MSALFSQLDTLSDTFQSHLPPQLQPYFTRSNLQTLLRIIVIISTFLLFQPQLDRLLRKIAGRPDPRQAEIDARLEFLKQQKEGGVIGGMPMPSFGGKIPVVNKEGKVVKLISPEEAEALKRARAYKNSPAKTAAGKKSKKTAK